MKMDRNYYCTISKRETPVHSLLDGKWEPAGVKSERYRNCPQN